MNKPVGSEGGDFLKTKRTFKSFALITSTILLLLLLLFATSAVFSTDTAENELYEKNIDLSQKTMAVIDDTLSDESFAGYYLNDAGELCLNTVKNKTASIPSSISDNVETNEVAFSLNELESAMDYFDSKTERFSISVLSLDIKENRIDMELSDISKKSELIAHIKNETEFKPAMFEITALEGVVDTTLTETPVIEKGGFSPLAIILNPITLFPGTKITNNISGSFTLGFAIGNAKAYTAGHACSVGDNIYVPNSTSPFGRVTARKYSGKCDAAMITFNNPSVVRAGLTLPNGNRYVSGVPTNRSFAQGTKVSLQGALSGRTNGKITKSSITITYDD